MEPLPGPFISYSRHDLTFARRLYDALRARNREAWVDLEGIEPSEAWLEKLHSAIDSARAFVFVLSPDSVSSRYCEEEIQRAAEGKKKLIPLLYRPVEPTTVPPALARLQWISFLDEQRFEVAVDELRASARHRSGVDRSPHPSARTRPRMDRVRRSDEQA